LTQVNSSISGEYKAALSGAAYFPLSGAGSLRISGDDRQAFLQRQTTNDARLLSSGVALVAVLTSPTARILDVLTLFPEAGSIVALTLPGRGGETFNYLRSRIFFMDKVKIEDASAELLQLDLLGSIPSFLTRLGFAEPVEAGQVLTGEIGGTPVQAILTAEMGCRLLIPSTQIEEATAVLDQAGAVRISPETHTILRVESGRPAAGHELVEEYTPLEAGLESAISDMKGCYTGQEVLARQVTYDKVTRHLAGLVLEGEAFPGDPVWSREEERSAGTVTSAANSPRFGQIALAILRRPYHLPETALRAGQKESGVDARVTALPFREQGARA
jgi:folate-binding protein YgfZ